MNNTKNLLIISTSLRKGGNSDTLAEEFAKGAREAGHNVEKVSLIDKTLGFCKGCLVCQKTGRCVIADDAIQITQKMCDADTIVFATPVYYYEMCGQMKTILDRANSLFSAEYSFRDIYLLATAAEDEKSAVDGTINGLKGWVSCFENAKLKGVIYGVGVNTVGEIEGKTAMVEAYEMGKAI